MAKKTYKDLINEIQALQGQIHELKLILAGLAYENNNVLHVSSSSIVYSSSYFTIEEDPGGTGYTLIFK